MIQLNLLPDIKKKAIKAKRIRAQVIGGSVLVALASGGVLALALFYVYAAQPIQILFARNDIKDQSEKLLAENDTQKYLTLQNQLSAMPGLYDNKIISSRLMDFLPIINPQPPHDISITALTLTSESNGLSFQGYANSFEALGVFVETLKQADLLYVQIDSEDATSNKEKLFSEVYLDSSAMAKVNDKSMVSFSIRTTYSTNAFSSQIKDVRVEVPSVANSRSADRLVKEREVVFSEAKEQVEGQ